MACFLKPHTKVNHFHLFYIIFKLPGCFWLTTNNIAGILIIAVNYPADFVLLLNHFCFFIKITFYPTFSKN